MYFWDEQEGQKTNNNILSAVHACLTDRSTGHEALHLWNDNTTAQMKGWGTVRYLADLAHPTGLHYYKRIDNLYPPVGHTFLENDRGFATISRAAKKVKTIPSCAEFMKVAETASWSNPAHCVAFEQAKHRDVSSYLKQFYNVAGSYHNTDGDKVYLDRIRWFNYGVGEEGDELVAHPNEVWYRESFDQTQPWKKISVARSNSTSDPLPLSDASFNLYEGPLPIDRLKAKDLFDMSRKFLTAQYHALYPPAPVEAPVEVEDDEEEPSSSSSSTASSSSSDAEEKEFDITDVEDGSMIVYDMDDDTIALGQVLAIDEEQGMIEVHRYNSYAAGRKLGDVSSVKFSAVYTDPKDGKHVYTSQPKKNFKAVTDYVVASEILAQNFELEGGRVPVTVAKASGLFSR
jgi:hypothetical protein